MKYLVVNQEKDCGLYKARPANNTVHTGNIVVKTSMVFKYAFHNLLLDLAGVEVETAPAAFSSLENRDEIGREVCKAGADGVRIGLIKREVETNEDGARVYLNASTLVIDTAKTTNKARIAAL